MAWALTVSAQTSALTTQAEDAKNNACFPPSRTHSEASEPRTVRHRQLVSPPQGRRALSVPSPVLRTVQIHLLAIQVRSTVSSITMLDVTSLGLSYFVSGSLNLCPPPNPPPLQQPVLCICGFCLFVCFGLVLMPHISEIVRHLSSSDLFHLVQFPRGPSTLQTQDSSFLGG